MTATPQKKQSHLILKSLKSLSSSFGRLKMNITPSDFFEVFHDLKINANLGGYRDVLRNLVDYEAGKTIFQTALGIIERSNIKQSSLFGDGF